MIKFNLNDVVCYCWFPSLRNETQTVRQETEGVSIFFRKDTGFRKQYPITAADVREWHN